MAKAAHKFGGETESIMGYFRPILEANPKYIKNRKNGELYERWLKTGSDRLASLLVRQGVVPRRGFVQ